MKIKAIFYSVIMAGSLLSACKYDTSIDNPQAYARIFIPQAVNGPVAQIFLMADTLNTISFAAAYGGPEYPGQDIKIDFKVDNSLISEFNDENGTNYEAMPVNSVIVENASATIKKGQLNSESIKIKIKTNGSLEAFKKYLLPVSIENTNSEVKINDNLKTAYFIVEGQKGGINLKIMSFGIKSGTTDMQAVADIVKFHNPDFLFIRELDSVTTRGNLQDFPKILSELTGLGNYVYSAAQELQGGKYGAAVYSRYPIEFSKRLQLYANVTEQGPLPLIRVKLNDTRKVYFAGTHLNSGPARRDLQVTELLGLVNNVYNDYPFILSGNMNDRAISGTAYQNLSSIFAFPCVTCPLNFPKASPSSTSDMTMYTLASSFLTTNYSLGTTSTSDHLPSITELRLFTN